MITAVIQLQEGGKVIGHWEPDTSVRLTLFNSLSIVFTDFVMRVLGRLKQIGSFQSSVA